MTWSRILTILAVVSSGVFTSGQLFEQPAGVTAGFFPPLHLTASLPSSISSSSTDVAVPLPSTSKSTSVLPSPLPTFTTSTTTGAVPLPTSVSTDTPVADPTRTITKSTTHTSTSTNTNQNEITGGESTHTNDITSEEPLTPHSGRAVPTDAGFNWMELV